MTSIDLFLEALSNRFDTHVGKYVCNVCTTPCKFPAYKTVKMDIWLINGENKQLISTESTTARMVEADEKQDVMQRIMIKSIENILKYYGL